MSTGPLVSVVITTFNRTSYLEEALASAIRQTYQNLEIIVSDDCGSTGVADIVARIADGRVRYRRTAERLGVAANTLSASLEAHGKYIAYLNDDDAWETCFLATLVPPLEANDHLAVAFSDHFIMTGDGVIDAALTEKNTCHWGRDRLHRGVLRPFCRSALVQKSIPVVMAAVIRRTAIDWSDFPQETGPAYDLWLAYLTCRTGLGAYFEPRRLTRYRSHQQAQTRSARVEHSRGVTYCYERFRQDPRLDHLKSDLADKHAEALRNYAATLLLKQSSSQARRTAARALRVRPSKAAFAALLLSVLPSALSKGAIRSGVAARDAMRRVGRTSGPHRS